MFTSLPSKKIWPLSHGWMPAMHLISVDLPAPLSPTSAITSPGRTSKSTSVRACTEPNDLSTPRSSRRGVSATGGVFPITERRRRPIRAPPSKSILRRVLLAELGVRPVAHVALLEEARREQDLVVRLRDRLRGDQVGGLGRAALGLDG